MRRFFSHRCICYILFKLFFPHFVWDIFCFWWPFWKYAILKGVTNWLKGLMLPFKFSPDVWIISRHWIMVCNIIKSCCMQAVDGKLINYIFIYSFIHFQILSIIDLVFLLWEQWLRILKKINTTVNKFGQIYHYNYSYQSYCITGTALVFVCACVFLRMLLRDARQQHSRGQS